MGQRMAKRLLDAGHELIVWNRSSSRTEALVNAGARAAATPREAAQGAQIVWSMVYDDEASRQVWLDPIHGAAGSLTAGTLAVESSTLTPAWIAELEAALARRGTAFVDAPVAGSRAQAEAGQLVFMVGGDAHQVKQLTPVFGVLGVAVHHVGPTGSGAWLKLAVNALFATQVVAMAEVLDLLRQSGMNQERALDALRTMPVASPVAAAAAALMLAGNYSPQAPVDLIVKDLGYAIRSAGPGLGDATSPLISAVMARFEQAQTAGYGPENIVAVAKLYCRASV